MKLHRKNVMGEGIAETISGNFTPQTARKFVKTSEWTQSFFVLENESGNKIPLSVFDENGQVPFDAAIFYDDTMKIEDKKKWLEESQSDYLDRLCHVCGESVCPGEYMHYE